MITQQNIKKDLEKVSNKILELKESQLTRTFTCNMYQEVFYTQEYIGLNATGLADFLGLEYCKKVLKISYRICFLHAFIGKIGGMNMSLDDIKNLCKERRNFAQWVLDNSEKLSKTIYHKSINNKLHSVDEIV